MTTNKINEIHISHCQETSIENLTKMESTSQQPVLFWCKGYLYELTSFENDELTIKKTKGIWYINSLTYSKSEKIEQQKYNGSPIEVIDSTGDPTIEKLFDYISEDKK